MSKDQFILTPGMREEIFDRTLDRARESRHSCKWCHGRGYEGVDVHTGHKVVCRKIMKMHRVETDKYIKEKIKEAKDNATNPTIKKLGKSDIHVKS